MTIFQTKTSTLPRIAIAAILAIGAFAATSDRAEAAGCMPGWSLVTTNTSFYCQRYVTPTCGPGTSYRRDVVGRRDKCTGGFSLGGNRFSVELNPICSGRLLTRRNTDRCRQRAEPLPFL